MMDSRFGLGQGFDFYDDDFEEADHTMGINQQSGDEAAGNTALARRIKSRLNLYEVEKPFRDVSLVDDASQ